MRIQLSKSYLFLLFPSFLFSQKIDNTVSFRSIESESYFRFHYDNDYFAATDENYTQGYNFELVLPSLEKNPINHLFFNFKSNKKQYGLAIEHIGFTPNDYVSEGIQFGDRPFAAAIMLKSFKMETNSEKNIKFSQSISLGIVGPGAFGKEMQVGIHRATGNKIPGGWDNQIKNNVVLNFRADFEKQVLNYTNLFALQADATVQFGTLFTNASVGLNTQIGILNSVLKTPGTTKSFQVYAYVQPRVSFVGYDATLQRGLFNRDSPYTISPKNLERFTAQYNFGLVVKTRTLYFEYTRNAITREFKSGAPAKWGGVRIGFTF